MSDTDDPAAVAHEVMVETILARYDPDEIEDLDVTARFDDGELTLDAYVNVPDEDTSEVVTEAIERATAAVDELLEA